MKEKILKLYEVVNPLNKKEKLLIPEIEHLNSEIKEIVVFSEESRSSLKCFKEKIEKVRKSYLGKGFLEFSIISSVGYLLYPLFSSSIFYFPLKNSVEGMINYYLTRTPITDLKYYASIGGKNLIQFFSYISPTFYQLWEVFAFSLPILVFGGFALYRFYKCWKDSQRFRKLRRILENRTVFRKDRRVRYLNSMIKKGKSLNEIAWKAETMGLKTVAEFFRYVEYWLFEGDEKEELDIKFLKEKYEI